MNLRKQAYRFYISFSLLLCFTATQLPFELFHTHNNKISCSENDNKDGICTHKAHIGKQDQLCFACIVQIEKTFDLPANTFINAAIKCNSNYVTDKCYLYSSGYYFIPLRGPPTLIV